MKEIDKYKPYRWVPSLYFAQALPFTLITLVSPVLFKNFNLSNSKIAFITSLFSLPWLAKPVLAPLLENILDKKSLTVIMELLLAGISLLLALSLVTHDFLIASSSIFLVSALFASLHDISSDGLYILSLNHSDQAKFIGVRCLFYQLGRLVCQGGLIFIAGILANYISKIITWQIIIIIFSGMMLLLSVYHFKALPKVETINTINKINIKNLFSPFKDVLVSLIQLPNFLSIIFFAIIYNFPEAQLMKIVPLFLLDKSNVGGLGLSTSWVGIIYGGFGITGFIIGITISGHLLTRFTLKTYLAPATLFATFSSLAYLFLSNFHVTNLLTIAFLILFANFGYGLSNGAYMVYLLYNFGKGSHPMSLFAIGTSLMSLGIIIAGAVSGYLQAYLGYTHFFVWIVAVHLAITLFAYNHCKRVT